MTAEADPPPVPFAWVPIRAFSAPGGWRLHGFAIGSLVSVCRMVRRLVGEDPDPPAGLVPDRCRKCVAITRDDRQPTLELPDDDGWPPLPGLTAPDAATEVPPTAAGAEGAGAGAASPSPSRR